MIHGFNDETKEKVEVYAKSELLNVFYPVGTVYETTNNSFNPNTSWGGTWVKIEGRFLLGSGGGYSIGATGGEATHTLTVNEMPKHKHTVSVPSTTVSITDGDSGLTENVPKVATSKDTSEVGGGAAHNNMPPYVVVNIWKRTA